MQLMEVCLPSSSLARYIHSLPLEARLLTQFTLTPIFWCYYFPFLTSFPPSGLGTVFLATNFGSCLDSSFSPVSLPPAVNSHLGQLHSRDRWHSSCGLLSREPAWTFHMESSCHFLTEKSVISQWLERGNQLQHSPFSWQLFASGKKETNWAHFLQATEMDLFGFCTFVLPSGIMFFFPGSFNGLTEN